jgi:hypothetical protein
MMRTGNRRRSFAFAPVAALPAFLLPGPLAAASRGLPNPTRANPLIISNDNKICADASFAYTSCRIDPSAIEVDIGRTELGLRLGCEF